MDVGIHVSSLYRWFVVMIEAIANSTTIAKTIPIPIWTTLRLVVLSAKSVIMIFVDDDVKNDNNCSSFFCGNESIYWRGGNGV